MTRVVVVEYVYDPPLTDEVRKGEEQHLALCLEVREVKPLRSFLSVDRARKVAMFEAPDTETVRNAHRSARVAFSSAWPADETGP